MGDSTYRAVFSGTLKQGTDRSGTMRRIGETFRLSPQAIERLFSGSPVIVKHGIDRATAERYRAVFAKAGAILLIEPDPLRIPIRQDTRIITPIRIRGDLAFSPLPCPSLGSSARGLALHLLDRAELPWGGIRLVSVFADTENDAADTVIEVALFAVDVRRPYLVLADHIRYHEFPDVAAGRLVDSLRRFASHVIAQAPAVAIDIHTRRFLDGTTIREVVDQLDFLTALGKTLDASQ